LLGDKQGINPCQQDSGNDHDNQELDKGDTVVFFYNHGMSHWLLMVCRVVVTVA
jgi:hypothetical protein